MKAKNARLRTLKQRTMKWLGGSWNQERNGKIASTLSTLVLTMGLSGNVPAQGLVHAQGLKEFEIREASTGFPPATNLAAALDALSSTPGVISYTVPTINYKAGPSNRFLDDATFRSDPMDGFALEATGKIVVKGSNLTWTFGVGSDDGFLLEIEGGEFIASDETVAVSAGSVTATDGNTLFYDGPRSPAESYGVFRFDSPGVYKVRLIFFEVFGGESLELFAAPGDQLLTLDTAPFELINADSKTAIQLVPDR